MSTAGPREPDSDEAATAPEKRAAEQHTVRYVQLEPLSLGQLTQVAIAVAIALAIVRLFAVADGDVHLAVAVLQRSGYIAPIVSIAITLMYGLIFLAMVYVQEYAGAAREARRSNQLTVWATPMMIWLGCLILILASWWFFLLAIAMIMGFRLLDKRRRRRARTTGRAVSPTEYMRLERQSMLANFLSSFVLVLIMQVASSSVWLPDEIVTVSGGKPIHGYVLDQDDLWVTVLTDNPRTLVYVPTGDVQGRAVCKGKAGSPSLVELLVGQRLKTGGVACPDRA